MDERKKEENEKVKKEDKRIKEELLLKYLLDPFTTFDEAKQMTELLDKIKVDPKSLYPFRRIQRVVPSKSVLQVGV
jgi:hypothetical protein